MPNQWRAKALRRFAGSQAMKASLIFCLAVLAMLIGSRTLYAAPGDPLEVTVDGRIVTYDPATAQGQLNGAPASLQEVLNALAPGPVQATLVEREMTDGTVVPLPGVEAVVQDHFIRFTNLSQLLATQGNISIWISGGDAVSSWKICIIIVWGSYNNPIVKVDQKPVDASDVVVELDGKASNLTLLSAALGSAPMTATNVIVVSNGVTLTTPTAQAVVTGNHIDISNLTRELALYGRLSIWISGQNWRICIIIGWGSSATLSATVDGQPVTTGGQAAQISGVDAEMEQVLAINGGERITVTDLEIIAAPGVTITAPAVSAVIQGNKIAFHNLTQELARYGRLEIWIGHDPWRICIIIIWGSDSALAATVDGRAVTNGGQMAQISGAQVAMERALALIGGVTFTDTDLEIYVSPGVTISAPAASAVMKGNKIAFHNLTHELAARGRLEIYIGSFPWRICIIIIWGNASNLAATVDGRPATVEDPVALVDGAPSHVERVLAINGSEVVTDSNLEITTPGGVTLTVPAAQAVMTGNRIAISNLSHELAQYGKLSIWISGKNWRICIIIVWGSDSALSATVDGRPATVEDPVAFVDGALSDMERVLAINGSEVVTDSSLEITTIDGVTLTAPTAKAVVTGNLIAISNLSHELAQYGKLSIWISGKNWRICIIIVWGNADAPTATVDGRDVVITGSLAQLQGAEIEFARALDILGSAPVTTTDVQVVTTGGVTLTTSGASAVMRGNQVELHGLSEQLAAHLIINIWVRFGQLRICITIEIDDNGAPTVLLNGRPVTAEGAVTEMAGEQVEPARLFTYLESRPPTTTTDIELVKNGVTSPVPNAQAIMAGDRITITGPADVLQGVRISIWINFRDFRVCIIISWERLTSPDGGVVVDVPPHQVHSGLDLSYVGLLAPTKPLPAGAIGVRHFNLFAHSTTGPVHQLDVDYTIKATYTEAQLASLNIGENSLRFMVLDAATNTWQPVTSVVDAQNNMVVGTLDHFSEFALLGDPAPERKTFLPIIDR